MGEQIYTPILNNYKNGLKKNIWNNFQTLNNNQKGDKNHVTSTTVQTYSLKRVSKLQFRQREPYGESFVSIWGGQGGQQMQGQILDRPELLEGIGMKWELWRSVGVSHVHKETTQYQSKNQKKKTTCNKINRQEYFF